MFPARESIQTFSTPSLDGTPLNVVVVGGTGVC
jgi:hypothetical protein